MDLTCRAIKALTRTTPIIRSIKPPNACSPEKLKIACSVLNPMKKNAMIASAIDADSRERIIRTELPRIGFVNNCW